VTDKEWLDLIDALDVAKDEDFYGGTLVPKERESL
jgi:hypothetical protein